jgi:uncharacterized protein (DUF2141 family)
MKRVLLMLALACPVLAAKAEEGKTLVVKVTKIESKEGEIQIALFTDEKGFPDDTTKAFKFARVKCDKPIHTFENLPAGKYVVAVYHDKNGNGKLDKSLMGAPKEPIGLSLGLGKGLPDFQKAKIDVSKVNSIEIELVEFGK